MCSGPALRQGHHHPRPHPHHTPAPWAKTPRDAHPAPRGPGPSWVSSAPRALAGTCGHRQPQCRIHPWSSRRTWLWLFCSESPSHQFPALVFPPGSSAGTIAVTPAVPWHAGSQERGYKPVCSFPRAFPRPPHGIQGPEPGLAFWLHPFCSPHPSRKESQEPSPHPSLTTRCILPRLGLSPWWQKHPSIPLSPTARRTSPGSTAFCFPRCHGDSAAPPGQDDPSAPVLHRPEGPAAVSAPVGKMLHLPGHSGPGTLSLCPFSLLSPSPSILLQHPTASPVSR